MKKILILSAVALCCLTACNSKNTKASEEIYLDESQLIDVRVDDILMRLTLEEKIALCHAQSKFSVPGVPRLGIPELWMNDGPFGIRGEVHYNSWVNADNTNDSCIAFPALTALAASWDVELAAEYGRALGEKARYRKKDVLLAPGLNVSRTPLNGRNFEYMGEDPFLISRLAVPYIREIQKNGVAVCAKHFALNNQEYERFTTNVEASDRALREIYLPAFEAAVKEAGAWSVMGAYNKFRGQYCCHNDLLLNDILKGEWNFDGVVVSDWGGVTDTYEAAMNGTDIEMGTLNKPYNEYFMADPMLKMVTEGEVPEDKIDDKVRRILKLNLRTAMNRNRPWGSFNSEEHAEAGREIAEAGIVLLRNRDNLLPIDTDRFHKVAIIGENATRVHSNGGGAAKVKPKYEVTPLEGIRKRFSDKMEISYAMGYCSDTPMEGYVIPPKYDNKTLNEEAVRLAAENDLVIFVGGFNHNRYQDSEAFDRFDYKLPYGQSELLREILTVNKNVIFVLNAGSCADLNFANDIPALLQAWYLGSEAGNALASVLSGDVNPSGKLPFSYYKNLEDCGAHAFGDSGYPGIDGTMTYNEDIYVGYRWLEKKNIEPLFPFGFGLSYTTFEYSDFQVSNGSVNSEDVVKVSFRITNTGGKDGAESAQVYVSQKNPSVDRPVKELKGFVKTYLKAGESKIVEVSLPVRDWAFWDVESDSWKLEADEYVLSVGASSDDIKCTMSVNVR